jgi:hypothetical protein
VAVVLAAFLLCGIATAGSITPEVYPSEEEIFEAYLRGDIDYEEYLILREILEGGIDSTEFYLLEEIPNINFFLKSYFKNYPDRQREQAESYIDKKVSTKRKMTGFLKNSTSRKLEENGDLKNSFQLKSRINSEWSCEVRGRKDYADRYEWTKRSLLFRSRRGRIKRISVGNFTTRFGLGLTVGYRGRLLEKSTAETDETILFPVYGGFNGIYVEGGRRRDAVKLLVHYDRDDLHELRAGAIGFLKKWSRFTWEATITGASLKNRSDGKKYNQYQLGNFIQFSGEEQTAALELTFSGDTARFSPALILETSINTDLLNIKFSGWHYGRNFISLLGGGRAGASYRTVVIDDVDFSFRDKRTDQSGLLFKSRLNFENDVGLDLSFSAWGRDKYNNSVRTLIGFDWPVSTKASCGIDFNYRRRRQPDDSSSETGIRTIYRIKDDNLFFRSYLGYRQDNKGRNLISLFFRFRKTSAAFGVVELWFNMDKINLDSRQLDYLYGYIRESIILTGRLELAAKYSYRYSRSYSDREESKFILETKLTW